MVGSLVLAFILAVAGLLVSNHIARTMDDLQRETVELVLRVYRLTDANKVLMVSELALGHEVEGWDRTFTEFSEAMRQFPHHRGLRFVSPDLRESPGMPCYSFRWQIS